MKAFHLVDEGQTWLQICPDDGRDWQEPILGWELIIELDRAKPDHVGLGVSYPGKTYYRHKDGRCIPAM